MESVESDVGYHEVNVVFNVETMEHWRRVYELG